MIWKISTVCILLSVTCADDKKWVWDNNSRSSSRSASLRDPEYFNRQDASVRYEVYENERPFNNYPTNGFSDRPYNQIPSEVGSSFRPRPKPISSDGFRPGGLYAETSYGSGYGQGQGNYDSDDRPVPDILTGPIPSWVKEGPYKEFDRCKCAEKFNCNSPGISYGHCDVGKQYCCYSTTKKNQLGGPLPSRPVHSSENGILVGPGGPFDRPNTFQRPHFGNGLGPKPVGSFRPGSGGFGLGGRPHPGFVGQNSNSPENGILIGPGGPYDRPIQGYDLDFNPRSAADASKRKS
ncbi:uncharacterized protein isoform X2 [Leptinotarsa decemlineata]|uniref:uncharacterized protein isoform X2 n=1 Tax=Leptinotarsa decemlineata TaxID=7539 RepID=UPI003D309555